MARLQGWCGGRVGCRSWSCMPACSCRLMRWRRSAWRGGSGIASSSNLSRRDCFRLANPLKRAVARNRVRHCHPSQLVDSQRDVSFRHVIVSGTPSSPSAISEG